MKNEKNISAKQDSQEENPRISCALQNQERQSSLKSQAGQGSETIDRLGFPRQNRIVSRTDFELCFAKGRRYYSDHFVLFALSRGQGFFFWRLGMAISRKFGNAVSRNRLKRLIRETFRLNQDILSLPVEIVAIPKRGVNAAEIDYALVESEMLPLLKRIMVEAAKSRLS